MMRLAFIFCAMFHVIQSIILRTSEAAFGGLACTRDWVISSQLLVLTGRVGKESWLYLVKNHRMDKVSNPQLGLKQA